MHAWRQRGIKAAIIIASLLVVGFLGLVYLLQSVQFKNWLEKEIAARTGAEIRLTRLGFSFPLGVAAENVQIAKPGVFSLQSSRLTINVNPIGLLSNAIQRLQLEEPRLHLDVQELMKQPSAGGVKTAIRQLNVHDGTVVLEIAKGNSIELAHLNLDAENLNLTQGSGIALKTDVAKLNSEADVVIKGAPSNLEIAVRLRPKIAQGLFSRKNDAVAQETLQIQATLQVAENQSPSMVLHAQSQQLNVGDRKITGRLDSHLTLDTKQKGIDFSAQAVLAGFPGSLMPKPLPAGDNPAEIAATGRYFWADQLVSVKSFTLKSQLGNAEGHGNLTVGDKVIVNDAQTALRELSWEALKAFLPAPLNQWQYQGLGEADLNWRGPADALEVKGVARSAALQIRAADFSMGPSSLNLPVEASGSSLQLKDLRLQGKTFAWKDARRSLTAEQLQVDGTLDYENQAPLKFAGRLTMRGSRLKSIGGVDSAAEQIAIDGKLEHQTGDTLKAAGQLQLSGAKFASPDNSRVGENVALNGTFNLVANPAKKLFTLGGKIAVGSGELLWGTFFGDLKAQKPIFDIDGDYWQTDDRLDCRRCDLTIANVGQVKIQGGIDGVSQAPKLNIQASSDSFLPGAFFETFIRETFKRQYPLLDKISVGGQLALKIQAQGSPNAMTVSGDLSLKDGEVRAKSKDWHVGPVALQLPFQLRFAGADPAANSTGPSGTLAIQSAHFGTQTLGPVSTSVSLVNNSLRFTQPVRLGLFGGTVEFSNLRWPDIMANPKELSFSASANGLQLNNLTQAMGWHPFNGTLTASIPQVQSTENILRTVGDIRADLFGGRMEIAKLEIEDPFSSLASIKLNTTIQNINLEQASKTFEFGRISGILEGSISDLVITDGQPAQFRADLHSVDRGTEQRISVEALNKITVLSTGENAGAVYGGLASLFDSFRYSKLGFMAVLKNDKLLLRGIESRDGQEFLVVGSILPPTVNIISHTQEIGFAELLRRLAQVQNSDKAQVK